MENDHQPDPQADSGDQPGDQNGHAGADRRLEKTVRPTRSDRTYRRESETQATIDPVPEEIDSPIAPQGYEPGFVEEIADLETPQEKRRKAIRYVIWLVLIVVGMAYFCRPSGEVELPNNIPIPYNLEERPLPDSTLFLRQIPPQTVGNFTKVHQVEEQHYEKPFVGARVAQATYTNDQGGVVVLWVIDAGSYINANRYMRGWRDFLREEVGTTGLTDRIWLETSFLEWEAPNLNERAYGFAWTNERFYFSVTSPVAENRDAFVENFPY